MSATIQKKIRNLRIFCRVGRDIALNGRNIIHQFGKPLYPDQDKFEDNHRDSSFGNILKIQPTLIAVCATDKRNKNVVLAMKIFKLKWFRNQMGKQIMK